MGAGVRKLHSRKLRIRDDCVSFIVMQDRGITEELTADEYFQQARFRALLREDLP